MLTLSSLFNECTAIVEAGRQKKVLFRKEACLFVCLCLFFCWYCLLVYKKGATGNFNGYVEEQVVQLQLRQIDLQWLVKYMNDS